MTEGNRNAYERGKRARVSGNMRVSPYYKVVDWLGGLQMDVTKERDKFWFAGYDGEEMPEEEA